MISPDVGGGFGMKCGGYPEDGLVLWASRRLGRPVKWTSTRAEALLGDTHGRDQVVHGELALDENGKISALRVNSHARGRLARLRLDRGCTPAMFSSSSRRASTTFRRCMRSARACSPTPARVHPYRGAGRPEATYLIERLLDRAAAVLGIDPVEIRRRNFIPRRADAA